MGAFTSLLLSPLSVVLTPLSFLYRLSGAVLLIGIPVTALEGDLLFTGLLAFGAMAWSVLNNVLVG
jgi:hypothetical protein